MSDLNLTVRGKQIKFETFIYIWYKNISHRKRDKFTIGSSIKLQIYFCYKKPLWRLLQRNARTRESCPVWLTCISGDLHKRWQSLSAARSVRRVASVHAQMAPSSAVAPRLSGGCRASWWVDFRSPGWMRSDLAVAGPSSCILFGGFPVRGLFNCLRGIQTHTPSFHHGCAPGWPRAPVSHA